MALIRPRLTDHFNVPLTREEVDLAIPFFALCTMIFPDALTRSCSGNRLRSKNTASTWG
jgi:hypothetical protein